MPVWKTLPQRFFTPVDASSISVFRIGFGIILLWDVWRYYANGWVEKFYIQPDFHFKYFGFEWVQAWSGEGMYIHFALMGVCAFLVIIGAFYRIAIVIFTLAFTYVFLLDQTRYLNHFYLVILFSAVLCAIPAHRQWSVDAWLRPKLRSTTLPSWTLWLLRTQIEIVLIYAGIVKINPDWLQLQPLKMWLAERSDFPLGLGYLFTQDWAIAIAAYGVILLHIIGAPLLLWKRTRWVVFCLYAAFHTLNHFVFNIGIFPWFTLFASLLFFKPDWPKRLWLYLLYKLSVLTAVSAKFHFGTLNASKSLEHRLPAAWQQNLTLVFVIFWTMSQIVIPLRHVLYPGNVSWTEEGHRFAWQMKLRDKAGWVDFYVIDADDRSNITHVEPEWFLTAKQVRKMTGRPDMILQFAHFLARHWREHYGINNPEVYASAFVSLNGRPPTLLVDPARDLAKVERSLWPADWIVPLKQPLDVTLGLSSE
ncbi:HTTM domain-containing protein [Kaarinaea lacus]